MKIAILWTFASDYVYWQADSALKNGHEVLLVTQDDHPQLPPPDWRAEAHRIMRKPSPSELEERLQRFSPDVIVIAGWHVPAYRKTAAIWKGKAARLMSFDAQWRATFKQRLGALRFRMGWKSLYDFALVPGERQATFARKVGFTPSQILYGSIPANDGLFSPAEPRSSGFISVSRLSPEKGVQDLLDGYRIYRGMVSQPWPLHIVGSGSVSVPPSPGLVLHGHKEPLDVANLMRMNATLVLASHSEPWGLVLHEAASTGLPIIATEACGAVGSIVLNGQNGWVVKSGDPSDIAEAMHSAHTAPPDEMLHYRMQSIRLAGRSTGSSWVAAVAVATSRFARINVKEKR